MALLIEQPWSPLAEVFGPADRQLGPRGRHFSWELDAATRNHEVQPEVVQAIHRDLLSALAQARL